MSVYAKRRRDLARQVREAALDAFVVAKPCNVRYLTGFTGDSSYGVVTPRRFILVSDDRYRLQIEEECPDLETHIRGHDRSTLQAVAEVVGGLEVRDLGVEANGVTLQEFETLRDLCRTTNVVGRAGWVERQRAIKDDTEIATLRRAIAVAERAFTAVRATMRPDETEKDIAAHLEYFIRRAGGEGTAFPPIVGVGARSALPHLTLSSRKLSEGDFVLIDWGARVDGYHSDLTRLVWASGGKRPRPVESRLRKAYTVVLEAQRRAVAALRPGVSAREVDRVARSCLADAGMGKNFTHGLGHGVGLEIHEAPAVRSNSDDVLRPGMVVTVEPGVYFPDFGGVRLEDDVWIHPDGAEVLTTLPRDWDSLAG